MTITQFAFGRIAGQSFGGQVPAMVASTGSTEVKTPTGSSSATTAEAPATGPVICRVSTDVAVYFAFGTTPDATATSPTTATSAKYYLPAGGIDYLACQPSDKAAVILA